MKTPKEILPSIQAEISKIPQAISITCQDDLIKATQQLSLVNTFLDHLTEEKEKLTKPLNQTLKEIRSRYKETEEQLTNLILQIKKEMSSYQSNLLLQKAHEEAKIAQRVSKGTLKIETALSELENLPEAPQKTTTETGSITFIATKRFEVVDMALLPIEYHLANDTMIRTAMKGGEGNEGKELPGVRYYIEQVLRNNR